MRPVKKIMLLGSYGQTNLGDDLLLRNYLAYFSALGVERIEVSVSRASLIPASVRAAHPEARYFELYRTPLPRLLRMLLSVDAVIYGGGSVYKELYASTRRGRYGVITRVMVFNLLARALRRPVYNLNISIGHIGTRKGRWITRLGLLCSNRTLMRDSHSYEYAVKDLGLRPDRIVNSADGLFLSRDWQVPDEAAPAAAARGRTEAGRVIGVNLVSDIPDWIDRDAYLAAANELIARLLQRGDRVVLMPFQHDFTPSNDVAFMKESIDPGVREHPGCTFLSQVTIDDVKARFAQLDLFVGMRFHSLLLAAVTQTPFVGVAYDVKCSQFLAESAYDHWVELQDMTSDRMLEIVDSLARDTALATGPLGRAVAPRFAQVRADLAATIPSLALPPSAEPAPDRMGASQPAAPSG
jgi:polysaccharide pyruvyl transferase WcaK-like protein